MAAALALLSCLFLLKAISFWLFNNAGGRTIAPACLPAELLSVRAGETYRSNCIYLGQGIVLCSLHAVLGSTDAQVVLNGMPIQVAGAGHIDDDRDVAILKIPLLDGGAMCAVSRSLPKRGDDVRIAQSIDGDTVNYHTNVLFVDEGKMTLSMPVNPGASGSPVFNNEGNLIGILTKTHPFTRTSSASIVEPIAETEIKEGFIELRKVKWPSRVVYRNPRIQSALIAANSGDYDTAYNLLQETERAITQSKDPDALMLYGSLALVTENYREAFDIIEAGNHHHPNDKMLQYLRGLSAVFMNKYTVAREMALLLKAQSEFLSEMLYGFIAEQLGDLEEAEDRYRSAIRHNAYGIPAYIAISDLLKGRGELPSALTYIELAYELNPDLCDVSTRFGALLYESNNIKRAQRILEEAHRAGCANINSILALAGIYLQKGRPGKAANMLEQYSKKYSSNARFLFISGVSHHLNNERHIARHYLNKLQEVDSIMAVRLQEFMHSGVDVHAPRD